MNLDDWLLCLPKLECPYFRDQPSRPRSTRSVKTKHRISHLKRAKRPWQVHCAVQAADGFFSLFFSSITHKGTTSWLACHFVFQNYYVLHISKLQAKRVA